MSRGLTELPEIPAFTSYVYGWNGYMVKLVNENHLTKFNDLTVVSDSETTSSTSWKRIVGIQQCYHCLRPI